MITSFYYNQFAVFIPQTDESCLRLLSNKYISLLTEKISTHFCPVKGLQAALTGERGRMANCSSLENYRYSLPFICIFLGVDQSN